MRYDHYLANAPQDIRAIVFGGKARLSGVWIPDDHVAGYVARDPQRLIAFMSLDPTHRVGKTKCGMVAKCSACAVSSCCQCMPAFGRTSHDSIRCGNMPNSTVCRCCCTLARHSSATRRWNARCRGTGSCGDTFPKLRLILAHLGHPYEGECVVVIRKHANVYADLSAVVLPPIPAVPQLDARTGIWRVEQSAAGHRLSVHNRERHDRRHPRSEQDGCRHCPAATERTENRRANSSDSLPLLGLA